MFILRLKQLREEHNMSQAVLARILGISQSSVGMWESGRTKPDNKHLNELAKLFNVSMDFLVGISNQKNNIPDIDNLIPLPETTPVPLIGTIACGTPIYAEQNIEAYLNVPECAHGSFALRCKGDSMINARIFDGDIVILRRQEDVEDGEIAAVLIDCEATLKRVRHLPGKLVLSPCNPLYDDIILKGEELDSVRILGKAVYFMSEVR